MRIGVAPHRLWPDQETELDAVLQTAVKAEELGFDHVFASGHVVAGEVGVTPDPLILLAAIAGATRRIGLVTSVLVLPLYNPVVVAHQTATLDRLSGGPFHARRRHRLGRRGVRGRRRPVRGAGPSDRRTARRRTAVVARRGLTAPGGAAAYRGRSAGVDRRAERRGTAPGPAVRRRVARLRGRCRGAHRRTGAAGRARRRGGPGPGHAGADGGPVPRAARLHARGEGAGPAAGRNRRDGRDRTGRTGPVVRGRARPPRPCGCRWPRRHCPTRSRGSRRNSFRVFPNSESLSDPRVVIMSKRWYCLIA
jgi:hypothetical protein